MTEFHTFPNNPPTASSQHQKYGFKSVYLSDVPAKFDEVIELATTTAANGIAIWTVVGKDADGKIVPAVFDEAAPANAIKPIGITGMTIKAAKGETKVGVIRGGHLNMNAINWPASFDTPAKKLAAFEGASSPTNIRVGTNPAEINS